MEIHKPKPVHSWRDFLKEVGTIVLGVSIALAAEQAVETVHWRGQVREAREVIATEMARNMAFGYERVRLMRCIDTELGAMGRILDTASRSGTLPPVGTLRAPPYHPWYDGAWDGVVASQTATHFPRLELADLGRVYRFVDQARTSNHEEMAVWSSLSAMAGPGRRLDPASEAELRKALSQARYYNRVMARSAAQMVRFTMNINLPFNADDQRFIAPYNSAAPTHDQCATLGTNVSTFYGEAPFADAMGLVDQFQKKVPILHVGPAGNGEH